MACREQCVCMLTLNDPLCQAFWLLTVEISVVLSANSTNTVNTYTNSSYFFVYFLSLLGWKANIFLDDMYSS